MELRFSVAMSVYKNDDPTHFDLALQSITAMQTVKPDEIVLVVDGPVPQELMAVVERYEATYPGFRAIRLEKNGGLGNALRLAVENCSCDLVARMDSDDISVPTRFAQQLALFEKDAALDICGGDITEFIGESTNVVGKRTVPTEDAAIKEYMKTRCAMNHVSVMFKCESVLAVGNYIDWFWNEDYYLWIRMQRADCRFANTGTVLVNVRSGADMYQRRGGDRYFKSEKGLQDYMLEHGMIGRGTYCMNVLKRWIVQKALPNSVRGWVFRTFAREH
ncbi:MAG: glycosyltransferase [Oscillospiraceae bacterium]|nr:glycosyltransferase [Oscillospiraceae bacterium]